MKNPGLSAFSVSTLMERPATHPIWGDVNDDVDPDRHLDQDEGYSDYMPPVDFGRWRTPGQPANRVPVHVGPPYGLGESPYNTIHGEVVTQQEQDDADRIIQGEHESDRESDNPDVAVAQHELRTPAARDTVATLSGLLRGGSPQDVGGLDEAHDYLDRHFTGVRVNPHHGTLVTVSPTGKQVVVRRKATSDIPEESFALTNKHGTFESNDPERVLRAMIAFQVVNRAAAQNNNLSTTSGIMDFIRGTPSASSPSGAVPPGAVWEVGFGNEKHPTNRTMGAWVVHSSANPPAHWHTDSKGFAYSPGHIMNMVLDPNKAKQIRNDVRHPGHTLTLAPDPSTEHTVMKQFKQGTPYWVRPVHPFARFGGDEPTSAPPTPQIAVPPSRPQPRRRTSPVPAPAPAPVIRPPVQDTEGDLPIFHPPQDNEGDLPIFEHDAAAQTNDLCPVCASGYLEPYDSEFHECLNCGSLVVSKHVGFDKAAATKPKGGLGRGLKDIKLYEGDPLGIGSAGYGNSDSGVIDLDETEQATHPLAGETPDPDAVLYQAPHNLLDKKAGSPEDDELDEHMGKLGFQPNHSPGGRMYMMPDKDIPGSYYRLTEGVPMGQDRGLGWGLTAEMAPAWDGWTKGGELVRSMPIKRRNHPEGTPPTVRQPLPPVDNRAMSEMNVLATGTHPIDDDSLNRAIRDVSANGRDSVTYQNTFMGDQPENQYKAPDLPIQRPKSTQQDLRLLSYRKQQMAFPVIRSNPGLTRFSLS